MCVSQMCHWIAYLNSIPCDYSLVNDFNRMHSRAYTCTCFHGDASYATKLTRLTALLCTAKLSHHNTLRHTVLHTHAHTHPHTHRCQNQERRISITLRSTEGELGDLIVTVVANLVTDKVAKVSAMFWTRLLLFCTITSVGVGLWISSIISLILFILSCLILHPISSRHCTILPFSITPPNVITLPRWTPAVLTHMYISHHVMPCQLVKFPLRPLSLHFKVHVLTDEELRRPRNKIKFSGTG